MKTLIFPPFLFFVLSPVCSNAQSFVSLSTGISRDVNNTGKSFYHVPVSLQWKPFRNERSALFFEFDYDFPFTGKGTGNAYTLNPSLPEEVTLRENIRPSFFTASIGFRMRLYTNNKNNSFTLNLLPGICNQYFKVDYKNYDKMNYEVLNPDVSIHSGGLVIGISAAYDFHSERRDMFLMLHIQSPPLQSTGAYPLSYKFVAPLQLTFGYKLFYNKRK